jgi:hypothetical protein
MKLRLILGRARAAGAALAARCDAPPRHRHRASAAPAGKGWLWRRVSGGEGGRSGGRRRRRCYSRRMLPIASGARWTAAVHVWGARPRRAAMSRQQLSSPPPLPLARAAAAHAWWLRGHWRAWRRLATCRGRILGAAAGRSDGWEAWAPGLRHPSEPSFTWRPYGASQSAVCAVQGRGLARGGPPAQGRCPAACLVPRSPLRSAQRAWRGLGLWAAMRRGQQALDRAAGSSVRAP